MTFILNLTSIFVLVLSIIFLKETPSSIQFIGIALTLCGVLIFFMTLRWFLEKTPT
ncbi:MAG: EamA family transporter [Thermoproteales archaeon]|nr:EamA family transporter [Thermoproteales archaeon]